MAAALGINALLAERASAGSGKIFDFGLTMPIQMIQFLLLMVFLDKVVGRHPPPQGVGGEGMGLQISTEKAGVLADCFKGVSSKEL